MQSRIWTQAAVLQTLLSTTIRSLTLMASCISISISSWNGVHFPLFWFPIIYIFWQVRFKLSPGWTISGWWSLKSNFTIFASIQERTHLTQTLIYICPTRGKKPTGGNNREGPRLLQESMKERRLGNWIGHPLPGLRPALSLSSGIICPREEMRARS